MTLTTKSPGHDIMRGWLVSDLCSIGWVLYGATRFGFGLHFPLAWCVLALAVRLFAAYDFHGGGRWLQAGFSVALILAFASLHSWRQAGALGLALGVTFGGTRLLGSFVARTVGDMQGEGIRFGLLQCIAIFGIHPYLHNGLLGAGDANSYSLLIADFLKQVHAGVFPVFIGQSEFAFNGGFHPLRNAPYLQHLAWVLDLLTLRTLSVFAILNLAVVGSMLVFVLGAYAALRIMLGRGGWLALGLAALYGLSPGVLAQLYGGDMYPTFMTLPFIPWLIFGIERSFAQPARIWPWMVQAAALAAIAMAHPPVAVWAGLLTGLAGLWVLGVERKWTAIGPMISGVLVFGLLAAYLAVSIMDLELPAIDHERALGQIPSILAILRDAWWGSLQPVSTGGDALLTDIQLGYALWAGLAISVAVLARIRSARTLLLCLGLLLLLIWPIPGVAPLLWRGLPSLVLVTNLWPMQRLYLPLVGVTTFLIAVAGREHFPWVGRRRFVVGVLLGAGVLWAGAEMRKFFRRADAISQSAAVSQDLHLPGNLVLSRTHSYEYLKIPAYFSYGHMDPRLETRLLDMETRQPVADATTLRAGMAAPAADLPVIDLHLSPGGTRAKALRLDPRQAAILRFDFRGGVPRGTLEVFGAHFSNAYDLPLSGLARSFGEGPTASHALIIDNSTAGAETVSFRFMPSGQGELNARVTVEPWSEQNRVIQLRSQTPFQALVAAERDCYLETPKLFLPGYEAIVDGVTAPVVRSGEGLVAVPLARGTHEVKVIYPGSRRLRWSYAGGMAAWLGLGAIIVLYACQRERGWESAWARVGAGWQKFRRERRRILLAALAAIFLLGAVAWVQKTRGQRMYGEIRLTLRLPWPEPGRSEPLVTTGKTGAGDFIYVTYVDGKHIQIGHDRWGYGGARSEPISVDYAVSQTVEISLGSLYPEPDSLAAQEYAPGSLTTLKEKVTVKWNGRPVLLEPKATHSSRPEEVRVGENTIGGSTTTSKFSGAILRVDRVDPLTDPRRSLQGG